jgi:hypothetical protein
MNNCDVFGIDKTGEAEVALLIELLAIVSGKSLWVEGSEIKWHR